MHRQYIDIDKVHPNEGQIEGLPRNPRLMKGPKFRKLCKSIHELPEMTEARDLIVYPHEDGFVAIGGNMRLAAYRKAGWKDVPCCILPDGIAADKLRRIAILDNNTFGENDWDLLANEWDSDELKDWGLDVWEDSKGGESPSADVKDRSTEETDAENGQDEADEQDQEDRTDFFEMMLGDRIYGSDNEFDIPTLRIDGQPSSGLLLPFSAWGADTRAKKGIKTYHFYVEDYRFEAIWKNPVNVLSSGCEAVVEPNLSLFDTTPVAYGLQQIYKKRWISRYFQECGIKVYADLNVSQKFYGYNRLGIPEGYNAFATRGYADRQEYLKKEIQIAREISGTDSPNMIVYGGGDRIKEICTSNNIIYIEQFMANRVKKGDKNG